MAHFIHIPRTGGTALRTAAGQFDAWQHKRAIDFIHEGVTDNLFTIVRDPYDRLVSICAFVYRHRYDVLPVDVFENWVLAGLRGVDSRGLALSLAGLRDVDGRDLVLYQDTNHPLHVATPMAEYIDTCGHPVEVTILRYETLTEDIERYKDVLGPFGVVPTEKVNASSHMPWDRYYSSRMLEAVWDLFVDDFILLGYDDVVHLCEKLKRGKS